MAPACFSLAFWPPVALDGNMTRTTRRLLLLGLPAGFVAVLVCAWPLWPRSAITRENAARIQKGMTLAQVEQLLGGPARNEEGPFIEAWGSNPPTAFWRSHDVLVSVWLDADGKVTVCQIHEAESVLDATGRLLGL
jgi:hypothetical protein